MLAFVQKYVLNYIMKYGGQALLDLIFKAIKDWQRSKEQEKLKKKLEEKQNDQNSTVKERADAYSDLINSSDSH